MENKAALVEGLLFIAGDDGISSGRLADVFGVSEEEMKELLETMVREYREDEKRGIELVSYGGKYKFVSKEIVAPYAKTLYEVLPSNNYSPAALETLAIIAYKQPITRAEIEEIRGVGCELILHKLVARNLIRECGRTEAPGRPYLYEVTETFMDSFKLESLKELPKLPDFRNPTEEKELFE